MNLKAGEENHMKVLDSSKANDPLVCFFLQHILINAFYVQGIVLKTGETTLNKTGFLPTLQKLTP